MDAALAMEAAGADLIDVGGESTRPGAEPLGCRGKLGRVAPVSKGSRPAGPDFGGHLQGVVGSPCWIWGRRIINDISALEYDPGLADRRRARRGADPDAHRGRSRDMYQRGPL